MTRYVTARGGRIEEHDAGQAERSTTGPISLQVPRVDPGQRMKRVRLSDLTSSRAAWTRFEDAANERAYRRWMDEQERGDMARDEHERRQEVDDDDE